MVAHPKYADKHHQQHVVFITESTATSTMGLTLNNLSEYNLQKLMQNQGIDWYGPTEVYLGGEYNPNALVMLHSDEWYSSNTMQVDRGLAISSDDLMIEKMEMGNIPEDYRLFVGCKGWEPDELRQELKGPKPKWLLLSRPDSGLIFESSVNNTWKRALEQCSQDLFNAYL